MRIRTDVGLTRPESSRMRLAGWSRGPATLAVVALLAQPRDLMAADGPVFPVDATTRQRAEALTTLPCTAENGPVAGFAPEPGSPSLWRVAGTLVSVRRSGLDRFAFVLGSPQVGRNGCAVRAVLVLPRLGTVLQCARADGSAAGLGVHMQLPSGRRDLAFWRADGTGSLERLDLAAAGLESDTGDLICSLPEASE